MEKIDDRDSSVVFSESLLGQDWSRLGDSQNTTSLTQTKGASVKITFYGTSIAVYGTVTTDSVDSGTMSEYIVDGAIGATYTTDPTEEMQYQVKFFQSATLSPGRHTLEVVNETEDGWLSLDFFLVANSTKTSAPPTSPTSSTLSSPSSQPSSISHSTVTVAFIPASTPDTGSSAVDTSTSTSNRKRPNAGVIAGSVLGGMICLILFIALIWFIRRKNADRYADEAAAIPADAPAPASKATRSLALAHHSHNSRTNAGYDASVKSDAVAQAHHQQHNHRRSNASASSVYPFSHSVAGIAQQAYHSDPTNDRQRGQSPAPPYFGSLEQHRPQPHERQHSMDPSRSGTPSLGHCHSPSTDGPSISGYNLSRQSPRTNLGVCGPGSVSEVVNARASYEHSSQYSSGIALRPFSKDASLLAYPETPPGLSRPIA